LSKLVTGAQQAGTMDLKGTPRLVVICCPANFDDAKKNATIEAGRLANLEVLRLLEEPVAAAIAYALDKTGGVDQTILVYDLGGGTFDVSILQAISRGMDAPAEFRVLAKAGVPILGGDDFDRKIMEIAAAQFETISGIHILQDTKDWGISRKALREAQQKLKEAAEAAKRGLTEAETAPIELPNLIKDEAGNLHSLEMEITREQFNDAVRDLILESKTAIEQALSEAQLTIDDISRIILVGGSTKVPLVKEMLTQMFGKEPYGDVDPDTVVARGAAIFGATLTMPSSMEDAPPVITIYDIVTHHLGIEVAGGKFSRLIEKGVEIPEDGPLTASKEYGTQRDNQTEIAIRVYQAATDTVPEYVATEGVTCIGEFFITGIPPKPAREEHVTITFEIDRQNLLKVRATSSSSTGELDIQRS
ncbi:MAG TPA: Hsp70 family protein, partial [Chthonomonadaceae bacterium]|nr:Hsp70 family protein [Chthonomonadaceae bacterium]